MADVDKNPVGGFENMPRSVRVLSCLLEGNSNSSGESPGVLRARPPLIEEVRKASLHVDRIELGSAATRLRDMTADFDVQLAFEVAPRERRCPNG